jgi:two-component system chemotaxis sensor kinase CheA
MSNEMEEIISEFITEAEESLDKIEPLFVELEQRGEDKDMLDEIFRSMHTIKGAAGFLNFQSIVDVAHSSENLMKKLRDGDIELSKQLMDAILKSIDMLRLLLSHLQNKDGIEEDVSPLVRELEDVLNKSLRGDVSSDSANIMSEQTESFVESTTPEPEETAPLVESITEQKQEEPPQLAGQEYSAADASKMIQEDPAEIQPPKVIEEEIEELSKTVQTQDDKN